MASKSKLTKNDLDQLLKKTFTSTRRPDYVTYDDYILPKRYLDVQKNIEEFTIKDTDVWICGFPKTGTTWLTEITWLIMNNLNYEKAKENLKQRSGFLDLSFLYSNHSDNLAVFNLVSLETINICEELPNPRIIKTHLPFTLLPQQLQQEILQTKVIYITRNPLDVVVSYYYEEIRYGQYTGSFEDFANLFLFDNITYSPFAKHVLSFWNVKNRSNILFLSYEELLVSTKNLLEKIALFLGRRLSQTDLEKLQEYVSFEHMKNNTALNKDYFSTLYEARTGKTVSKFFRSGKSGTYRSIMSEQLILQFEDKFAVDFQPSDFDFVHV